MKNLILCFVLSLITSFSYSQNCVFPIYVKSFKRNKISFYINTNECLCTNNVYTIFKSNGNDSDGYLTSTETLDSVKIFHLESSDHKTFYDIKVEPSKITIVKKENGRKKVFVSKNFETKWLA